MSHLGFCNKAEAAEAAEDIPVNPLVRNTLGDVINRRFNRRDVLAGVLATSVVAGLTGPGIPTGAEASATPARFSFEDLDATIDETHHVAKGYRAEVLLRWGDPLFPGLAPFDPAAFSPKDQLRRVGYNNDYLAFFPIDGKPDRALLCINHEFTNPELMFPGIERRPDKDDFAAITAVMVETEMAAHGITVVELHRTEPGRWEPVTDSRYNRRVSPLGSKLAIDGPAAGHARMKTAADPSGRRVVGTLNNCAGGRTPWGTYLTAEENFHGYFWTDATDANGKRRRDGLGGAQQASYERYGLPSGWYNWGRHVERFNIDKAPNEPNRFGWIVEIDPFDPASTPVKHTALGRFAHEGAEMIVNGDGRAVVYCGDDGRFEYVYRFVSASAVNHDRRANMTLLSEGTLSVARFNDDGSLDWLPLVFGDEPLTPENGFESQADVLIDARLAADRLGATPMDRPEDVQPQAGTGKVFVMLTNNTRRKAGQADAANPRPENAFGHILELTAPGGDHAADRFRWEILVRCGDPGIAEVGALWNPATADNGWFAAPDNCAVDADGRLWIATDQGKNWPATGKADGLYALETEGAARGLAKPFFQVPVGAELCGPCFTPDGLTAFVAVQHPAADGVQYYPPFARPSTFADPATRWPDFADGMPPRPAIVMITREDGGKIGG